MSKVIERSEYNTTNFTVMVCRHGHWNIWHNPMYKVKSMLGMR